MVPLSKKTKKGKEERIYVEKNITRKSCSTEKGMGWERAEKGLQRKRVGGVRELTSRLYIYIIYIPGYTGPVGSTGPAAL